MKDIRILYETFGAEEYYRSFGENYENPHEIQVQNLIIRNLHRWNYSGGVLDFCAGSGEVTRALQQTGVVNITGCDPFTYALYEKQTGLPCARYSFEDIIKGADIGQYSLIICSFALHLCPTKDLFPLIWALLTAAPKLVVITPHKRPELELLSSFSLQYEDFELTEREKKVRLKEYILSVV